MNQFAVDQNGFHFRKDFERAAGGDHNVGVFACFQRTDTVGDADMFGRVDGDSLERVKRSIRLLQPYRRTEAGTAADNRGVGDD